MENINDESLIKYQVTIQFEMDENFMNLVPAHRILINNFIEKGAIDYYALSIETQRCWMIMNAGSKLEVENQLMKTPLYKYWTIEIDELFVYDAQSYRLPALQLN
jgi:hypothetical protein